MITISDYLKGVAFYPRELDDAVLDILTPQFYKKEPLFKPGRVCPYIWYLQSGLVAIREERGDKDIYHWLLEAPAIIIEPNSSLDGLKPATMFIEPIKPCITKRATILDVRKAIRQYPEFQTHYEIINAMYRRLQNEREADLRALKPEDRFHKLWTKQRTLFDHTPDKIMMSYINISHGPFYDCKRKYIA